jgi:ArsR family transcriptional regulator
MWQGSGVTLGSMADIFDVVADPTRRDLLRLLLDARSSVDRGELSVGEIVDRLSLTQPTVSKHLRVLRDSGLVRVREDGQHRYYSLDAEPFDDLANWLAPFAAGGGRQVEQRSAVAAERSVIGAAFAAWSGAGVGRRIGRAAAERSHRAQSALLEARDQVGRGIQRMASR